MNPTPRIPTIIGLLLLAIIVGGGIFVIERFTKSTSQASDSYTPKNVEITNITEASFVVSWTTSIPANGLISIVPAIGLQSSAFDDRDTESKYGNYFTHHVTARNLTPETSYTITILSNGKKFQGDQNPWRTTTYSANSSRPNTLEPAYGTILTPEGQPAAGTLVYITLEGGQTLSTLANTSGSWVVPLTLARLSNGSAFIPTGDRVTETIVARFGNDLATATTDSLNDAPVPDMTLGKTYDFRRQQGKKSGGTGTLGKLISESHTVLGSQTASTSSTASDSARNEVTINSPSENASLSTFLPLVTGKGIIGKTIAISLNNPQQTGQTVVGPDGTWRFTPKSKLAPGDQVLTVKSEDKNGIGVTLTRHFEILKSGTQVLGIATPSGSLTPTVTVRITPSLTPSIAPNASLSASPTTTQTPPVSGSSSYTIILILFGFILLCSGAVLLYKEQVIS